MKYIDLLASLRGLMTVAVKKLGLREKVENIARAVAYATLSRRSSPVRQLIPLSPADRERIAKTASVTTPSETI